MGLLPILTGAAYFEFVGALIAAGSFAALVFVTTRLYSPDKSSLTLVWIAGILVLGGLFGFLGAQLMKRLRIKRQGWLDAEEKKRNFQGERLRAIYELISTLTATLSYKRVLDSALDMGYSALNPDINLDESANDPLVSAVLLFRGGQLRVGFGPAVHQCRLARNL